MTAGVRGRGAEAATGEPILLLGIQRHTAIDRVASDQLSDYLGDHGETVLKQVALGENERRCRQTQCLEALAQDHRATLLLSGDVSSTGPNNTLRVQVHLYDLRRRGTEAAQSEMENLCVDCDETKLGILLANTTMNVIARHRMANPNPPPLPPRGATTQTPVPSAAQSPPPVSIYGQFDTPPPVPLTMAIPPAPTEIPAQQAPPPVQQQVTPPGPVVPQPSYPPPYLGPDPQAQNPVAVPSTVTTSSEKKGLSRNRKIIAGVFGALGIGALVVAAVMTGMDHRLAPNYSYNPNGQACQSPENTGKVCVLSTVGLYAPLYAVGGLLVGGMALTLALPESRPRPPPPPQDGTP